MDELRVRTITELLLRWESGDGGALERLIPLVYTELHAMAARYLGRERSDHTLQATGLVHEAFLRLVDQRRAQWQNRAQFFGVAAQLMRRILVDHARRGRRAKRGGGAPVMSLQEVDVAADIPPGEHIDVLAVDEELQKLEKIDPRQARIVELRFFGGLTVEETGEVVGLSAATVKREWSLARAWLYRQLGGAASAGND